jgi:hexosaminidase
MCSPFYFLIVFFSHVLAVWPAPQSFTSGNSVLWIAPSVHVTYNGGNVWSSSFPDDSYEYSTEGVLGFQNTSSTGSSFSSQAIVHGAISRALQTLFTQNLVPWKLVARNQLSEFEPAASSQKTHVTSLDITQTGSNNSSTFKPLAGQLDESYTLDVGTDGTANITAVSSTGVLHALETFIQLFHQHSTGAGIYTNLAPVSITDAPKFPHRGLNMDVSRNWYPMTDILRTIDALSWNKFNVLHIHMTDSQSWPMDIPALPLLSQNGAYQTGLSYSPSDIQLIQTYAIERGINVIIEFDMPGHTTSIGYGYPDLIAASNAVPWDTYCAEPPCGTLQLNNSDVDTFLETLFSDVLPRVQPYTAYFHTGGDEVNAEAYTLDPTVKSNDPKVIGALIQKLVDRNHAQIRAAGLAPIVWEEMLLDWDLNLGDDVVVQCWLSDSSVAETVAKGHKALAGNYNFWVSGKNIKSKLKADYMTVPRLWKGSMARLRQRSLIPAILSIQRLLLASKELASRLLV